MASAETGSPTAAHEALRRRHLQEMQALAPGHFERLSWSAERLHSEREARLRTLVRYACERSPWHRQRLADIDPGILTEDDLPKLPVMTTDDLMWHFDEIVTDPRLTLEKVEAHLDGFAAGTDAYLLDRYHVVASSGSSGRRGVFVYDWRSWADCYLGHVRYALRELLRGSDPAVRGPVVMVVVAAEQPTHLSGSLPRTFSNPTVMVTHRFPVTLPLERIVAGLNGVRPDVLNGYPSVLHQLAFEAQAGTLEISPKSVNSVAEPLLPEIRSVLEETWTVPVHNWIGQGLPHQPLQPGAPAHPLRDHRRGNAPRGPLPVRLGAPTRRGHPGAPGRHLLLPWVGGGPPARLPLAPGPGARHRRVPGPPDRPRRRHCHPVPGRGGLRVPAGGHRLLPRTPGPREPRGLS
jgi:hypothetical protein